MSERKRQDTARGDQGSEERVASKASLAGAGQDAYVLDSSALLCLMNSEQGADRVAAVLSRAVISAVNLAEVATKLNDLGADAEQARSLLAPLHLAVVPFDESAGFATGALRAATRGQGLSLGDRACLELAVERRATALTTDNAWGSLEEGLGMLVELLR